MRTLLQPPELPRRQKGVRRHAHSTPPHLNSGLLRMSALCRSANSSSRSLNSAIWPRITAACVSATASPTARKWLCRAGTVRVGKGMAGRQQGSGERRAAAAAAGGQRRGASHPLRLRGLDARDARASPHGVLPLCREGRFSAGSAGLQKALCRHSEVHRARSKQLDGIGAQAGSPDRAVGRRRSRRSSALLASQRAAPSWLTMLGSWSKLDKSRINKVLCKNQRSSAVFYTMRSLVHRWFRRRWAGTGLGQGWVPQPGPSRATQNRFAAAAPRSHPLHSAPAAPLCCTGTASGRASQPATRYSATRGCSNMWVHRACVHANAEGCSTYACKQQHNCALSFPALIPLVGQQISPCTWDPCSFHTAGR